GGQLGRTGGETGFLFDLLLDSPRWSVVHVRPTARQRPFAVDALAHEQHAIVAETRTSYVDFRRGVTVFDEPRRMQFLRGVRRLEREQFSRDIGNLAIALAIVFLAAKMQPRLRERQEAASEIERCGHDSGGPQATVYRLQQEAFFVRSLMRQCSALSSNGSPPSGSRSEERRVGKRVTVP